MAAQRNRPADVRISGTAIHYEHAMSFTSPLGDFRELR